jgi:hypothetical protein
MKDELPVKTHKKKIDVSSFVKRAKELKKIFEEERDYLRKKEIENESILSGKSF